MTESEIAQKLETYRDSLGTSAREPIRRRSGRRYLMFSPLAAAIVVGICVAILPGFSQAATLRRLDDAITNVKSMVCRQYIQAPDRKGMLWTVVTYANGRYREDHLVNEMHTPVSLIYRDGLCYEVIGNLDHATVRPERASEFAPKLGGEAIDVIKQALHDRAKGSEIRITPGDQVNGRTTYQVHFDRTDGGPGSVRHIVLVVDQATNLPTSADYDHASTLGGGAHWEFQFNAPISAQQFAPPPNMPIVDLRKTIPAFVESHHLTTVDGLQIFDACVTRDGTIWIATGLQPDDRAVMPNRLQAGNHVTYSSAQLGFSSKLSDREGITLWAFATAGSQGAASTHGSLTFKKFSKIRPIPNSDATWAGVEQGSDGRAIFPIRQEGGDTPSYFSTLGFDTWRVYAMFQIQQEQADLWTRLGKFGNAAALLEAIGDACKPENRDAYLNWMSQAAADYQRARMTKDEARVQGKMEAVRTRQGSP